MTQGYRTLFAAGLASLALVGCSMIQSIGQDESLPEAALPPPLVDSAGPSDPVAITESQPPVEMEKVDPPTAVIKAVADPARPAEDLALDEARKPAEVMAFAGIDAGQVILEMEAGGGYFTELLSRAVGPGGRIYMQNPPAFDAFLGDAVNERLSGRLANVTVVKTNFDRIPLGDNSVDVVTWFQGPHELWYTPEGADPLGDHEASFAAIMRVLKPGGTFAVIDHRAASGTPPTSGGDTHRIDPQIVVDLAQGAGFVVAGESDMLRSAVDDLTLNVFDERVRRKTDQFYIVFRKPG